MNHDYLACPLSGGLGVLGRKWTLLILRDIGYREINGFKQLTRSIGRITPRVLSLRLQQLMQEGLVERTTDQNGLVIWCLTPRGKDVLPVLEQWVNYRVKWEAHKIFREPLEKAQGYVE